MVVSKRHYADPPRVVFAAIQRFMEFRASFLEEVKLIISQERYLIDGHLQKHDLELTRKCEKTNECSRLIGFVKKLIKRIFESYYVDDDFLKFKWLSKFNDELSVIIRAMEIWELQPRRAMQRRPRLVLYSERLLKERIPQLLHFKQRLLKLENTIRPRDNAQDRCLRVFTLLDLARQITEYATWKLGRQNLANNLANPNS